MERCRKPFSRFAAMLATVSWCSFMPVSMSRAADITHQTIVDDIEGILIEGDISSSDEKKFREISIKYKKAIVVLDSNGGALLPAIEIGKIIKIAGYATLVPNEAVCASSCALIWVAGAPRWLSPKGRVGFHASYRDNSGKLEESGVANALVGNYLTLLNLPQKAIIFATMASPDEIYWLTKANKFAAGIDFEEYDPESSSSSDHDSHAQNGKMKPVPPVIETVRISPVTSSGSGEGDNDPWIEYATDTNGTVYYYRKDSIERVGSYVKVWGKADHSYDKTVSYRSSITYWGYSCDSKLSQLLKSVAYDSAGTVVASYTKQFYKHEYNPLVPDSVGMELWTIVCAPWENDPIARSERKR